MSEARQDRPQTAKIALGVFPEHKELYLKNLRDMVRKLFQIMEEYKVLAREHQSYINGYMMAGRTLGIVANDELKKIMEQEILEIFGMTTEKRRRSMKIKKVSIEDDEYLDVPTVVRKGINVW